jgi:hypothetical protein
MGMIGLSMTWFYLVTAHTSIHVINTKPKLMKLEGCILELKPQIGVSWGMNIDFHCIGKSYPYNVRMFCGVLQC